MSIEIILILMIQFRDKILTKHQNAFFKENGALVEDDLDEIENKEVW